MPDISGSLIDSRVSDRASRPTSLSWIRDWRAGLAEQGLDATSFAGAGLQVGGAVRKSSRCVEEDAANGMNAPGGGLLDRLWHARA